MSSESDNETVLDTKNVETSDEEFDGIKCSICLSHVFKNLIATICKSKIHYMCEDCCYSLIDSNPYNFKCPICRVKLDKTKVSEYKIIGEAQLKLIGYMELKCPSDDCQEVILYNKLESHLKKCKYVGMQCKYCKKILNKKKYKKHKESCNQLIECENCNEEVKKYNMQKHLMISCKKVVSMCENEGCEKEFAKEKQESHNKKCKYIEIECPNKCGKKIVRNNIEIHETECEESTIGCDGCDLEMKLKHIKSHQKYCQELEKECKNGCGITYKQKDSKEHYANCKKFKITCSACKIKYSRDNAKKHAKECKKQKIICDCGKPIKREDIDLHKKLSCDMILLNCKCGETLTYSAYLIHIKTCEEKMKYCDICKNNFPANDEKHEKIHKIYEKYNKNIIEEEDVADDELVGGKYYLMRKLHNEFNIYPVTILHHTKTLVLLELDPSKHPRKKAVNIFLKGKKWKNFLIPYGKINTDSGNIGDYYYGFLRNEESTRKIYKVVNNSSNLSDKNLQTLECEEIIINKPFKIIKNGKDTEVVILKDIVIDKIIVNLNIVSNFIKECTHHY